MTDIPDDVVLAAAKAIFASQWGEAAWEKPVNGVLRDRCMRMARAALEAAAPKLRVADREPDSIVRGQS